MINYLVAMDIFMEDNLLRLKKLLAYLARLYIFVLNMKNKRILIIMYVYRIDLYGH